MNEIYLSLVEAMPIIWDILMASLLVVLFMIIRDQKLKIEELEEFRDITIQITASNRSNAIELQRAMNAIAVSRNKDVDNINLNFKEFSRHIVDLEINMIPLPAHDADGKFSKKVKVNPNIGKYECLVDSFDNFTKGKFYKRFESRNTSDTNFILIGDNRQRCELASFVIKDFFCLVK